MPVPRRIAGLTLALLLAAPAASLTLAAPRGLEKKPLNALAGGPRTDHKPERVQAQPGQVRRGTKTQYEVRLGLPTFLWAGERGKLDPALKSKGPVASVDAAWSHLAEYAPLYRLDPADLQSVKARTVHDIGHGPVIVSFSQEQDGIAIFREEMRMEMDRGGDLVAISGYLTHSEPRSRAFDLRADAALAAALSDLTGYGFLPSDLTPSGGPPRAGYREYLLGGAAESSSGFVARGPLSAKKVWFRLADGLEPAWSLNVQVGAEDATESAYYGYVVSARDGSVLFRKDYTADDVYSYRVWADPASKMPYDGPQGTDPTPDPNGIPDDYQAPFIPPPLVSLEAGPISTGDPWLPAGSTTTNGNNVDAYADIFSPDGFSSGDLRATTTSTLTFDRTYDTSQAPDVNDDQRRAAITQLFYMNNWLHDWYYDAGFDEAAGDAQGDNYGRGGIGGDKVLAEGQDYSGLNNANMSTPPDGFNPVMQMYIFTGAGNQYVQISSPPSIAGQYAAGYATFGPSSFDVTGGVVLVNDGSGATTDGCEIPFANAGSVSGHIALVDRGTCSFIVKAQNAQSQGAIGVILANTTTGTVTMSGTGSVSIPMLSVSQADGNTIKANLGSGVTAELFRESTVNRDGTIDDQIIAHEWGHYISNRLVGNAQGLDTNMAGGLGEGWADFHAMLMTVRPEDANVPSNVDFSGAYAMAGYATGGPGTNSYYFGIRRTPYSTDFAKDPLTFKHIQNGVALPTTAPIAFGQSGSSNAEVHNTGEIWANMLWECYASLLRDTLGATPRLTFDEAQQRMKEYLVAAYKMTPSSPTLLEARDAVLAAALANDSTDFDEFWQAFAKRGAGVGAVAPDRFSLSNSGVVESFSTGGALRLQSVTATDDVATDCFPDGDLDDNETGTLTITLENTGSASLSATTGTVSSTNPGVTFPSGSGLTFSASSPFGTTVATVPVSVSGIAGVQAGDLQIDFDDPGLVVSGPVSGGGSLRLNADEVPAQSATDDVESNNPVWTSTSDPSLGSTQEWSRIEISALDHRWLGPDNGSISDVYLISPPLQVASSGSFSFTFSQRHDFEASGGANYDGGVIEISTNGGTSWSDIGASASPGYSGILATGGGNPLEGRSAYVATNASYPGFDTVTVSLGTAYQGQTVMVRFRIGSDVYVSAGGWDIDDIAFSNITNTPFPIVVAHDPTCDADTDGFVDTADCAPNDGSLWSAPSAVTDLAATGGATTGLSWSEPSQPGGTAAPTYDLLRSDMSGSFATALCLAADTGATTASDTDTPSNIFYYLVGARDACGRTIEPESDGTPRNVVTCTP